MVARAASPARPRARPAERAPALRRDQRRQRRLPRSGAGRTAVGDRPRREPAASAGRARPPDQMSPERHPRKRSTSVFRVRRRRYPVAGVRRGFGRPSFTMYRSAFPGHDFGLRRVLHVHGSCLSDGSRRLAVALDQPVPVAGRLERREGLAAVLRRLEPAQPEQVLLQGRLRKGPRLRRTGAQRDPRETGAKAMDPSPAPSALPGVVPGCPRALGACTCRWGHREHGLRCMIRFRRVRNLADAQDPGSRGGMKDFGPSCFPGASTVAGNANAAQRGRRAHI